MSIVILCLNFYFEASLNDKNKFEEIYNNNPLYAEQNHCKPPESSGGAELTSLGLEKSSIDDFSDKDLEKPKTKDNKCVYDIIQEESHRYRIVYSCPIRS